MAKAYATLGKLIKDSRTMIEEMDLESDQALRTQSRAAARRAR